MSPGSTYEIVNLSVPKGNWFLFGYGLFTGDAYFRRNPETGQCVATIGRNYVPSFTVGENTVYTYLVWRNTADSSVSLYLACTGACNAHASIAYCGIIGFRI